MSPSEKKEYIRRVQMSRTRRRDGKTCLHYSAREQGHLDGVKFLVEEQVIDEYRDGTTPFHMACFGGHCGVNFLLAKAANILAD
jgi:hypothetical protein